MPLDSTSRLKRIVLLGTVFLLASCASSVTFQSAVGTDPVMLSGYLERPQGSGPHPAAILLHTCAGLQPHVLNWATWFRTEGCVAFVVQSFPAAGRGSNVCREQRNPTFHEVALDAVGALRHLTSLPFVDRSRVIVVGFSYGANAALVAASLFFSAITPETRDDFRAAVALYPGCYPWGSDVRIPVLLLLGEADTTTPPHRCLDHAAGLKRAGRPVEWKVYRGATHQFDKAELGSQPTVDGRRFDGWATKQAERDLREFLRRYVTSR